jgi:S1-C subfamily serine protease
MGSPACGAEGIVERARRSVCLIQGSYIFRDKDSGNVLRRADWVLDGDDTELETSYTGTGFLISSDGRILTNRHIAQPWWKDADAERIVSAGYRPELKRLTAYFPARTAAYRLTPLLTSKRADLAVVRAGDRRDLPVPLPLGGEQAVVPGIQVFILGYPAGAGAIIGRTGQANIESIPGFLSFTDQRISEVLAMGSLTEPFLSVGYLSNVANDVYTVSAVTSGGSSGSPVLDRQGKVIAIHSASLTGVAGGGLAVPSRLARELVGAEQ